VGVDIQMNTAIDWKSLRILLEQLAHEEEENVKQHERTTGPYYLQAAGTYQGGPFCSLKEHKRGLSGCLWALSRSMNNDVRGRVVSASAALGCPADVDPIEFWLDQVFRYREKPNNEPAVPTVNRLLGELYLLGRDGEGRESLAGREAIIPRVYRASARLCAHHEELTPKALADPEIATSKDPLLKKRALSERDTRIWEVIQRGVIGLQYCRELDNARIRPRKEWLSDGCPGTYQGAYQLGQPWQKRIQDEKSKITRKARPAPTRHLLAGE
jgi:hypothetical protein